MDKHGITFSGQEFQTEKVSCDFCGGNSFSPLWESSRHGVPLKTVLCEQCGLCMTNPRMTETANEEFYKRCYHKFHKRPTSVTLDSAYVEKSRRMAARRLSLLTRFLPKTIEHEVFEVGVGAGQFQLAVKEGTSWRVSGIDPGDEQVRLCTEQGLDVQQGFVETTPFQEGRFTALAAFHVLEHLRSPGAFIKRANELLQEGGIIYLEVPNLLRPAGYTYNAFFQLPHMYNFTLTTLRNYLSYVGGFRPLYSSESPGIISIIGQKIGVPIMGPLTSGAYEQSDINDMKNLIKIRERIGRLAAFIPSVPILKKVRATLISI
jgi:2-polyprenyl-3-methyl-5-hydroxy-6-metoxy-1,4-benzoquinol methylase